MPHVERVLNGRYHHALGMTPFEAYYGTLQVHEDLVSLRKRQKDKINEGKKEVGRGEQFQGNCVLVYEFEQLDRGRLGKLATKWTGPHCLGNKVSTSIWEVIFARG